MFKNYIKKLKSNQSGFTLIELIIVITVLGVIVAAFLPRTGGNVEKTKQVMHENLLNTISSAIAEYGTENKLSAGGDSGVSSQSIVDVSEGSDTLLRPIDKDHPLVTGGYLDKVPLNPWASEKGFGDFKYVVDFKLTKRPVSNPDGTNGVFLKIIPVVKLVEVKGNEITRDNFVVVVNGKTKKTLELSEGDKGKVMNSELFGYNFVTDVELDEGGQEVEQEQLVDPED